MYIDISFLEDVQIQISELVQAGSREIFLGFGWSDHGFP